MVDPRFPSMKARQLRRVIDRLGYVRARMGSGSHQRLAAHGLPPISWAFHDGRTLGPVIVYDVLCVQIGLDIEDALALSLQEGQALMIVVRMLHQHDQPYGWYFSSPDLLGLVGGADTYAESQSQSEAAARFHLECEAEEQGRPVPDLTALEFEHFVPASEAPVLAA